MANLIRLYVLKDMALKLIKALAIVSPFVLLIGGVNFVAVTGTIQALSLIPVALHWLVILLGVILLIPLNVTVAAVAMAIVLIISQLLNI